MSGKCFREKQCCSKPPPSRCPQYLWWCQGETLCLAKGSHCQWLKAQFGKLMNVICFLRFPRRLRISRLHKSSSSSSFSPSVYLFDWSKTPKKSLGNLFMTLDHDHRAGLVPAVVLLCRSWRTICRFVLTPTAWAAFYVIYTNKEQKYIHHL